MITKVKLQNTSFTVEVVQTAGGEEIWIDQFDFVLPDATPIEYFLKKQVISFYNEYQFPLELVLKLEAAGVYKVWFNTYRNKFWQGLENFNFPDTLDSELKTEYEKEYELAVFTKREYYDLVEGRNEVLNFVKITEENVRSNSIAWQEAMQLLSEEKGKVVFKEIEVKV